jgi:hypothetical protein
MTRHGTAGFYRVWRSHPFFIPNQLQPMRAKNPTSGGITVPRIVIPLYLFV